MALYLNLYHEVQTQKLQEQRDPLKLGLLVLILIAAGFALYYFVRLRGVSEIGHKLAQRQAEWAALEPKLAAARAREVEIAPRLQAGDTVVHRINERFYWAPILERLIAETPRTIQLQRVDGGVAEGPGARVNITLAGTIAGEEPRIDADGFRTALERSFGAKFAEVAANFRELDEAPGEVTLDGKALRTANFTIALGFARPAWNPDAAKQPPPPPAPPQ